MSLWESGLIWLLSYEEESEDELGVLGTCLPAQGRRTSDRENTGALLVHPHHLKPIVYTAHQSLAGLSNRTDMTRKKTPLLPQPPLLVCLTFIQEAKAFGTGQ